MLFIASHSSVLTKVDRGIWPQRYCVPTSFVTLNRWEEERDLYVTTLHIALRERLQSVHLPSQNTEYFQERENLSSKQRGEKNQDAACKQL